MEKEVDGMEMKVKEIFHLYIIYSVFIVLIMLTFK